MGSTDNFAESRRYPRKSCASSGARLFFDGTYSPGHMVDVSEGGMMMVTSAALEPNQKILAHFQVGDTFVRAKVEVVYVLPDRKSDAGFRVGMRFTAISDFGLEVIRNFSPHEV